MSEKKFPVITITREYCAYGRTVAQALSKKLGVDFYDRDIVNKTIIETKALDLDAKEDNASESNVEKFLKDMLGSIAAYSSSFDKIFEAQKGVILNMAKEPCIIVGRCANIILKDAGIDSFDVFLYADMDHRMERCKELNPDLDEDQLEERIRKVDEDRKILYKNFGKTNMYDVHNYDLCINVGAHGIDKTVEMILDMISE
ncbi:MAG: cytidylate kinase-like family protein [Mogibacterium sp.]|nr:cytidylate kinase-like family protein [Mogibacterium sp.]